MLNPRSLRVLALAALTLAALAFLTGLWRSGLARPIQLIRPDTAATAELFGTPDGEAGVPGTPIGRPQLLIIRSAEAFLPGTGEGGVRYVSEPKLRELGQYPLQQKTVLLLRNLGTLGLLALATLLWGSATLLSRRRMPARTRPGT